MKMIRFPNRVVFDPGEPCSECLQDSMLIAELSKSIRCFHCGSEFADPLCWFCKDGVSRRLLRIGNRPICLRGHMQRRVEFCRDFVARASFGTNWKKDMGERRMRAEEAFSKIIIENCDLCRYWNTDNVMGPLEILKPEERKACPRARLATKHGFLEGHPFAQAKIDWNAAFCELGKKAFRKYVVCGSFEPAQYIKQFYEYSKRTLPKYVESLKFLELLYPARALPKKS